MLRLQQNTWLNGAIIDEFVRLLNVRQRRVEGADASSHQTLFFDTVFSGTLHPPGTDTRSRDDDTRLDKMLRPDALLRQTGCERCCLHQDSIIFPVHVNSNHWVTVKLDMTACSITFLDSLKCLGVRSVWTSDLLAGPRQQLVMARLMSQCALQPCFNHELLQGSPAGVITNVKTWLHSEMSSSRHADCHHSLKPAEEWVGRYGCRCTA